MSEYFPGVLDRPLPLCPALLVLVLLVVDQSVSHGFLVTKVLNH